MPETPFIESRPPYEYIPCDNCGKQTGMSANGFDLNGSYFYCADCTNAYKDAHPEHEVKTYA